MKLEVWIIDIRVKKTYWIISKNTNQTWLLLYGMRVYTSRKKGMEQFLKYLFYFKRDWTKKVLQIKK